ncbi:MAG: carbohydrate kinase [Actinobacteria bacterium]|nr:MAG: carbohydrate kinase [Actinomycetota bacterium]
MDLVVGVDLATAAVRAVAAGGDGKIHAESTTRLSPPCSPRPGWVEQDARTWWPAVEGALRKLTSALARRSHRVVALSVCATSGTVVAVDARGAPLGPALTYADQRATREAEKAQAADTGRWTALGLRVQPFSGLAKWGWLAAQPGACSRAARLAHASDVVVAQLVGGLVPTDWSSALKSGYDPLNLEWSIRALSALGIPLHLVPEVMPPATAVGTVSAEAAGSTGLPRGCHVRLGTTDACAAQLAAGADSPGRFVSVLGTTLVLKGASPDLVADSTGAVYSHRHPLGWWLPGGASNTGGSVLSSWFPGRDLKSLDREALRHGPARSVAYPLVGRGERFPFVAGDAEGFVLDDGHGGVDRYRAALEGVAFVERLGYEHLARLGAPAEGRISTTGRGSTSRVWNAIRATVLGVPLVARADATTARGACILAAAGTLHPDLASAAAAMGAPGEPVEPLAEEREPLEHSYRRMVAELTERGWLAPGP